MLRIKARPDASAVVVQQQRIPFACIPLKRVNIDATIRAFAADVTITQVFRNEESTPIEAVYCFPIEEQAAVYKFVAQIEEREIVAQLKEKVEAQQKYNEALKLGHGAYLLEQDEKSQDNFVVNVGALPPAKECTITISYVTELDLFQGSTIRFVVPTTIAPRYSSDAGDLTSPAGTTSKYVQTAPYTISLCCQIEKTLGSGAAPISRVSSSSHPIDVNLAQEDAYVVTFAQENTHLDRDILVNIELCGKRTSTITAVEPGAVMATFVPTEEDCHPALKDGFTNEFIFVVDCSGSMQSENKIGLAKQAMLLFLKSLPVNCHFNIIQFGSQYKVLFNEITAVYNEANAQNAERLVKDMQADLGGTELLQPLKWIQEHLPEQARARQIFLLTDGEISNVTEVLDLCHSMATSTRIFSFGLGQSPSRSLVKGLARATNGRFVFIPPNASVDIYVGEQLQKALQPCITNVQVKWNLGVSVDSAPTQPPPVYANDRLIVYALIDDSTSPFAHESSVELLAGSDHRSLGVAKVDHIPSVSRNGTLARLAAKALILELQHTKSAKQQIIALSLKYNILSPHTAFVGTEKRTNASNADMVLREVPIEISADDKHLQGYTGSGRGLGGRGLGAGGAMRHRKVLAVCASPIITRSRARLSLTECKLRKAPQAAHDADDSSDNDSGMVLDSILSQGKRKHEEVRSTAKEVWPSNDRDIVRRLIDEQKFDGVWDLDAQAVNSLTGKTLDDFRAANSRIDHQVLVSAIVVAVLETRFATLTTMWHGIVQKARKRLIDLLRSDSQELEQLLNNVRKHL